MNLDQAGLIVRDPATCHGQAVVRGTRVMVSVVLDALADGLSEVEILAEYPTLTVEGIRAVAACGAELARDNVVGRGQDSQGRWDRWTSTT